MLNEALSAYQCAISEYQLELHAEPEDTAKNDFYIIGALLVAQHTLAENERLVVVVDLEEKEEAKHTYPNRYADAVASAPEDFIVHLSELTRRNLIHIEGAPEGVIPKTMEIIIPPNTYNQDDSINASSSAAAHYAARNSERVFLEADSRMRYTTYLQICPTGHFLAPKILFHPSIIQEIRIDEVSDLSAEPAQILLRGLPEVYES